MEDVIHSSRDLVQEGPSVVICNGDKYKFLPLIAGQKHKLFDKNIDLSDLIGKLHYGQVYQYLHGAFLPLAYNPRTTTRPLLVGGEVSLGPGAGNNRNILDDGTAQTISHEEIEGMKKQGLDGNKIVAELVQNSQTFQQKSNFSKEKYVKRKVQKYVNTIQVFVPTAFIVCESYFSKTPMKIMGLRPDSLSQILTLANLESGANVGVMENCNGLLTAAVAERLGVEGHVIKIHTSSRAMEKVGVLDHFPKDVVNRILHLPVTRLLGFEKPWSEREQREGEFKEDKNYIKMWETERKRVQAYDITCAGLESLILAVSSNPLQALASVYEHLLGGRPFVLFSEYLEPLTRVYWALKRHKAATCLDVTETWTQEYQVLPERTHPSVKLHGASGYILFGVKTLSETPFTYSSYCKAKYGEERTEDGQVENASAGKDSVAEKEGDDASSEGGEAEGSSPRKKRKIAE